MILGIDQPGIPLDTEDAARVSALMADYARIRHDLSRAEKRVVGGGMDILMMLDGCSLDKAWSDVTRITAELELNRTEVEPKLMADLRAKYGEGFLDPRNMKWIEKTQ
jgi:hypothetical protein